MIRIAATSLDLRTATPFGLSRWSHDEFANVVVTLTDHQGRVGRGEAAPNARYGETRDDDLLRLAGWTPAIERVASEASAAATLAAAVDEWCGAQRGSPALRAALSAAAWDLSGIVTGAPVWRLLGLTPPRVLTSYTIAVDEPGEMIAHARAAVGFPILKVKLGFDGDIEVAERLARELPDRVVRYDANEGWDRERAARSLERLAALGAELVEQPLPAGDLDGQAWLHDRSALPLFADEALRDAGQLDEVAALYDGVVVKLQKAGGVGAATRLIDAAHGRGLSVLLGCMVESSLGIAAALHLASLADHVDLDGALLLADDPFTGLVVDGHELSVGGGPGLGVASR